MIFLDVLLFFPSVTFGLLSAEIFPWGVSTVLWGPKRYNKKIFVIVLYFIFYTMIGFLHSINDTSEVLRSLMAYLNVIFVVNYLMVVDQKKINKLTKLANHIFIFFIILGILQFSGLLSPLTSFFKLLVPRGSGEMYGKGRGVSLLSTEPSRAGIEVVYIYTLFRLSLKKKIFLWDLFLMLYLTVVVRSAAALFLYLMYLVFEYRRYWYLMLISFILLVAFGISLLQDSGIRAVKMLLGLFQNASPGELFEFLLDTSGFRLVSIIAAYIFGIVVPFGYGIGTWKKSMIKAFNMTGFDPGQIGFFKWQYNSEFEAVRPTSYFANMMIDMGVIGSMLPLIISRKVFRINRVLNKENLGAVLLFLFTTFLFGSVGNPIPWIVIVLILKKESGSGTIYDN